MNLLDVKEYKDELLTYLEKENLRYFDNKTLFITGASGLIMSYFIDLFILSKIKIKLVLLTSSGRAIDRFKKDNRIRIIKGDVRDPAATNLYKGKIDYVLNFASLVDPRSYQTRPIDTMTINILGTKNLLDLAYKNNAIFLFASSCEVYGEINVNKINETDFGLINTLDARSCYNESKRSAETLCASYAKEKNVKTLIARFSRTFGPTQSLNDTKALSQFMLNALRKEDIIIKSNGNQLFSYTYVQDAVSAIIIILKKGHFNEAYNVANKERFTLKQIANMVSKFSKTNVIINLNNDNLRGAYSKSIRCVLDCSKLNKIGWSSSITIREGIYKTLRILQQIRK